MKTAYHGISKVLLAKKTGVTFETAIVIDGTDDQSNAVGQIVINWTQNKTSVGAGLKPNSYDLRSPLTGTGTLTLPKVDRTTRKLILNGTENTNGGIAEGSAFKEKSRFGITVIQQDAEVTAGKVYYDVVFSEQSADTYNSLSSDAPEALPLTLNIEVYPVITRKADGSLFDFAYTSFNSVDDAANLSNLITKIVLPTTEESL